MSGDVFEVQEGGRFCAYSSGLQTSDERPYLALISLARRVAYSSLSLVLVYYIIDFWKEIPKLALYLRSTGL